MVLKCYVMKNYINDHNEAIESKWQSYRSRSDSPCPNSGERVGYTFKTVTPL